MHYIIILILLTVVNGYTSNYLLTNYQQIYQEVLQNIKIPIVLVTGPAGTGKTMIACNEAISLLKLNKVNKIIITRPLVTVEENIGYLPGTIEEKLYPFMVPIYDYFLEHYTKDQINKLISNGRLEVAPLAFMRGRTFSNTFVIADEMQNSSPNQFKMLLTRIGENSKIVITGDLLQNDLGHNNGLKNFLELINKNYNSNEQKNEIGFHHIEFQQNDIKRNIIIHKILELYNKN